MRGILRMELRASRTLSENHTTRPNAFTYRHGFKTLSLNLWRNKQIHVFINPTTVSMVFLIINRGPFQN